MALTSSTVCTAFKGHQRLASGSLPEVALTVKRAAESGASEPIRIFDDLTGYSIDLELEGSENDILARLANTEQVGTPLLESEANEPRTRGRPKLGVIAREVTLLPRHW